MMKRTLLSALCLFLLTLTTSAHALWIETDLKGTKGKAHTVNIFFGEFGSNERDTVATWFSNLKSIEAFVTLPDGSHRRLELTAAVDHYTASFIPETEGVYAVAVSHTVADIYGDAKLQYYTTGIINVNANNRTAPAVTALDLQPSAEIVSKGKNVTILVTYEKTVLPKAKVVIMTTDGWVKTLYTDEKGMVSFKPNNTGHLMLEAVRSDKTPGTHNGKDYKSVTHLLTHCIEVK